MTTYVISEQPNAWHVYRHGENVSVLGAAPTEERARQIAFDHARMDTPSCILRIGMNGQTTFLAMIRDRENFA